ncbi:probable ubiquitin-conjugating enzyme E2 24 [Glycine soja]|uniref:Putative ubiquitin-conjugating enzyme E2 23 n=1 Tax=Glycine soja TaxID=3848 RepID=A0A445K196_GLYSO|nr:probable ubiquitin-conjugating enzyme E2 24 [Glycine soja]RZC04398.1 putative ubiquitin-conjugating enzyme E2 23 [Glycine soja]
MENTNGFVHFDVVSDDADHHFLGSNKGKCFTDFKSEVYRTIMKEWKILEQNLPESIYVRVYERRIDLMRAVIVGAAGTPYHDGLFFFDIGFPSDYPKNPPKLHYHSFGYRHNPNLYSSGRVCLSLLNTWTGRKSEKWDPSGSTMLQVLLSIQALVLNKKPYYNEPGLASIASSEWRSRAYNENVFLITCSTSLHLLRRPPFNFEAFVSAHFRQRAFRILSACSDYTNGRARVGHYSFDLRLSSSSSKLHVSRSFKKQMIAFYPRLLQAFRQNGASLEGFVEHLELESKHSENKSGGIFKKVMEKIKKAFGLKKNKGQQSRLESA